MNNTQARRVDDSHNPDPDSLQMASMIEGDEKLGDWLEHREIVVQELCPVGALETLYTQRAALYLWRIDLVGRFEIAAKIGEIEAGSPQTCEDPANAQDPRVFPDSKSVQSIIKYEAHLQRCLAGTMAELRRLQKDRRQGLRDANSGGRGADRAGVSQNEFVEKGSPCGSPSLKSSPTQQITRPEMSIPGGRGADRAGVSQNEFVEKGSPCGSPLNSSPPQKITDAEMSIPGGRGADRAGICQNPEKKDGSHGGSPSLKSPPSLKNSPPRKSSPHKKNSTSRKNSTRRNVSRSQRASPAPKIPPLLDAISARRRLCESIAGETFEFEFERRLPTATLDFSIGRCS